MITFQVDNLMCRNCAAAISRAISTVDSGARTSINIAGKRVRVTSSAAPAELLLAIENAGYPAKEVQLAAATLLQAEAGGGCCCRRRRAAADEVDQGAVPAVGSCCA